MVGRQLLVVGGQPTVAGGQLSAVRVADGGWRPSLGAGVCVDTDTPGLNLLQTPTNIYNPPQPSTAGGAGIEIRNLLQFS